MVDLSEIYFVILPLVLTAAMVEGVWLSRTRDRRLRLEGVGLLAGRSGRPPAAALRSARLIAPWLAWAWEHRLFTQSLDNVGSVLLLFFGLEFFYYWYHRFSHTTRWFWAAHSPHHSPNQLNLSAAYRLGWFGRLTGTTLFFTPLVLLGFTPAVVLIGAGAEPALSVLAACRLDPPAGLAGVHVQHAVEPSRPSRAQSGISRRQLSAACWSCSTACSAPTSPSATTCRCDYGTDHASHVLAQSVGRQLLALDRPLQGPALGALAARGLDVHCSARRAGGRTARA